MLEKAQYRVDHSSLRKCYKTPEGYLYAEATFARDGILEYTRADGSKRRELRLPEENKKALTGFGRKPFTIEHPTVLVNSDNSKILSVGITDPEVVYDKSGFVRGVITVMDSQAVDLITSNQKPEVSVGYQCRLDNTPGIWNGMPYDAIQREIVVNHVCCTSKGRAGQDVRIHLDSEEADKYEIAYLADSLDTQTIGGKVADLTIRNATFKDLPAEVVSAMSSELHRLDSLLEELKELKQDSKATKQEFEESSVRVDSLSAELAEVIDRADTQEGRADRLEELLEDASTLLSEEGYKWDSENSTFVREDMGNKKDMKPMEEEDDEEEDEEMPFEMKGKKKDGYMKKDSVEEIVAAVLEAEALFPGIRTDSNFSGSTVREIQESVISRLDSEFDLSEASDGYVAGVYFGLTQKADSTEEAQEETTYAQDAFQQVSQAGASRSDSLEVWAGESGARMANAWQQPLS